MNSLVSIVITSYNKAQYLEQSVQSVLAQTYSNIECIIIDDGSTDNTAEIAAKITANHPEIKYFLKENGGVSSARNFGVTKAHGEWIQFLDADDWIAETKIASQLNSLEKYGSQPVVAYADYERVYVDKDNKIVKRQANQLGQLSKDELVARLLICPDFLADSPFPLLQQAMLFSKTLLDNNEFDTTLKACEDREFVLDLLMSGVPFIHTPIIGAFYRKHATNMTDNDLLMRESYIGYFEIAKQKHGQAISLPEVSLNLLLDKSLEVKDKNIFDRTLKIVEFPVAVFNGKLKINRPLTLQVLYYFRLLLPNFLLYQKYRGPRSQKIFRALQQIIKLPKSLTTIG